MTDEPSKSDVESLVEQIDERPWTVSDYYFEGGSSCKFTATIEIEWVGARRPRQRQVVYEIIESIAEKQESGAGVDDIVVACEEMNIDPDQAREEIETLRRRGDIYEPVEDQLRVV